ncbi:hypothetical protein [Hanstruepera flava]|uniref:hypothetical protein n=1 Tax=Hanstruepera flava TaxID=2930218 RepID=UPI002028D545|nr:hypothetical protein [Hanstruepera flava]
MKYFNYLLIVIGCAVAIYAQAEVKQNELVLISGIVILMLGVYRISKTIPSKFATKDNDVIDEEE